MDEQQPRPPVFELHIRPMMRLLDREHMRTLVHDPTDLWDLDTVWSLRAEILTRVRDLHDMPGIRYGGPWPDEWITLFERWTATGTDTQLGHHLLMATPSGDYRVQSLGGGKRRLIVTVTAPSESCQAWFELDAVGLSELEYTLWLEPPYPELAPNPQPLQTLETFVQGTATQLVINDLFNGQPRRNEIPLT